MDLGIEKNQVERKSPTGFRGTVGQVLQVRGRHFLRYRNALPWTIANSVYARTKTLNYKEGIAVCTQADAATGLWVANNRRSGAN